MIFSYALSIQILYLHVRIKLFKWFYSFFNSSSKLLYCLICKKHIIDDYKILNSQKTVISPSSSKIINSINKQALILWALKYHLCTYFILSLFYFSTYSQKIFEFCMFAI